MEVFEQHVPERLDASLLAHAIPELVVELRLVGSLASEPAGDPALMTSHARGFYPRCATIAGDYSRFVWRRRIAPSVLWSRRLRRTSE